VLLAQWLERTTHTVSSATYSESHTHINRSQFKLLHTTFSYYSIYYITFVICRYTYTYMHKPMSYFDIYMEESIDGYERIDVNGMDVDIINGV